MFGSTVLWAFQTSDLDRVKRGSAILCALFAVGLSSTVQAAEPPVPDAGTLLQELKPVEPPTPSASGPALMIEPSVRADLSQTPPFPVSTIEIFGNTTFDTSTLHGLIADAEGQSLRIGISNACPVRGRP